MSPAPVSMAVRPLCSALLAAVVLLATASPAEAVNRCEGRDGRITYTDEPCPANARNARRVDDSPPVQVREASRAAPAAEASKDAAKDGTKDATKDSAKDAPRDAAATAEPTKGAARDAVSAKAGSAVIVSGSVQAGRIAASANPEQEIQRLDELRVRQQRQCAELRRRIDYARSDLNTAGSDRASAELALRRLQEEARTVCPR